MFYLTRYYHTPLDPIEFVKPATPTLKFSIHLKVRLRDITYAVIIEFVKHAGGGGGCTVDGSSCVCPYLQSRLEMRMEVERSGDEVDLSAVKISSQNIASSKQITYHNTNVFYHCVQISRVPGIFLTVRSAVFFFFFILFIYFQPLFSFEF